MDEAKSEIIDTANWLTPKEVATQLRYKKTREVYKHIERGEFTVFNRGDPDNPSWLIEPQSVLDFQRRRIQRIQKTDQPPVETPYPPGVRKFV